MNIIKDAIEQYQQGGKSAWACADEAGITLWEFLEILKQREIYFKTDEEELFRSLKEFNK
jgi:predicted HTH domain antitoxin